MYERDLGRVARAMKHALAKKGAAQRHAIQASDQFVVIIDFDRVAMAALEQGAIDASNACIDPGAGTVLFRLGAAFDHGVEIAIHMDGPGRGPHRSRKARGNMKSLE